MTGEVYSNIKRRQISRITGFYYGPDDATIAYHRILAPARMLGISVLRGIDKNGNLNIQAVKDGDLLVIQRDIPRNLQSYRKIVQLARQLRKPIIWEIDDLLFDLSPEHPDRLSQYFSEALLPMLEILLEADLVTVPSQGLKDYFAPIRDDVIILPNFIDDQLWSLRPPLISTNSPLVIGYMGSHSHKPDIEMIMPVINYLLAMYPNRLRFVFWGKDLLDKSVSNYISYIPIDIPSYPEFVQYFQTVKVDIFMAPLKDSLFNVKAG